MSEFNNRVRDSVAVAKLKQANARLAELSARDWEHQPRVDLIDRLISVGENTLARLSTNRDLIAEATLNSLAGPAQAFGNVVEVLAASASPTNADPHRSEANNAADAVLMSASALPTLPIRTTSKVFGRVAEQFDREVESATAALSERVETMGSHVAEMSSHLEQASDQFIERVSQLEATANDRFAQADSATASVLAETQVTSDSLLEQVKEATERLEREVTSIQEVFRNSQRDRDEEFRNSQDERGEGFRRWLNPTIEDVESFRDQARSMLGEVAGASTAEHYAKQRDNQRAAADRWRTFGVASLLFLVLAAGWMFFDARTANQNFAVVWLIARSGLVASIFIFATYALSQSSHHRRREEDMSRVSNELQLLWPFMSRLPDQDRQALLRDITPLYFKGGISAQNGAGKIRWTERLRHGLTRRRRTSDE